MEKHLCCKGPRGFPGKKGRGGGGGDSLKVGNSN